MAPRITAGLLVPAALISSAYSDADEAVECLLRQRSEVEPEDDRDSRYDDRRDHYLDRWQEVGKLHDSV